MCSRTARRVYTTCAVLALIFGGTVIGALAAQGVSGDRFLPSVTVIVLKILLIPGAVATGLLWVAMFYFWFGFDSSNWAARTRWFLLLYLLSPFGPALYCFFVYRKLTRDGRGQLAENADAHR